MTEAGVLIVGAGLAGLRTAQGLRRNGYPGTIRLLGCEDHFPYDRPPLSKGVLTGDVSVESLRYADRGKLGEQGIEFTLGTRAVGLDLQAHAVVLENGQHCEYDELVVATGATARQPFPDAPAGVHSLRTLDDALAVRSKLRAARRLVVIGAGFIGLEVASSARMLGVDVTVVEAEPRALGRSLDDTAAAAITSLACEAGVDVRFSSAVTSFVGTQQVEGVVLADGQVLPADVVVVGVGAKPESGWLHGSGVPVSDGAIVCDPTGRVYGTEHVWAVGDVAAWRAEHGKPRRREHWTAAVDQANLVALNLADGGHRVLNGADYVWSEQFGQKVSIVGQMEGSDDMRVLDSAPHTLAVLYASRGRLVGACIVGQMPLVLKCRRWVAGCAPIDEVQLWLNAA